MKKYVVQLLILAVLCYGLFLRTYDLTLDPPMTTGTFSQDLATDPYHITSFAANKVKFGQWELFEYPQWQVFKVSLPSALAYLLYSLGDVNIFWTHLTGVILGFLGIIFLLWGIRRNLDGANMLPVAVASVYLAVNFILVTYTRMPFLETGVIFCFGLIVLVISREKPNYIVLLMAGTLVSIACLSGRMFAASIGLALITAMLLGPVENKWKKSGMFLGSSAISGAALLLILYGGRIGAYLRYLAEHTESSGGTLYILQGTGNFIDALLSYGTNNQLFRDSPFLFFAGYIAITAALLLYREYYLSFRQIFFLRFGLWWAVWLFLFFFPLNYRPLRYSLLLYLPLVMIMTAVFARTTKEKSSCPKTGALLSATLLFALNHYFLTHLVIDFFLYPNYAEIKFTIYGIMVFPATIITAVMIYPPVRKMAARFIPGPAALITALACCSLIFQTYTYFQWIGHSHHTAEKAARDTAVCLSDDAVIAGPYAPRLTLASDIKSFIYYFGLKRPDTSIFNAYPITHIAVDKSNLEAAVRDFPELQGGMIVADQLIRARSVILVSPPDTVSGYIPTTYEKAERFLNQGIIDSALIYNRQFRLSHPENIAGMKQAFSIFSIRRDNQACKDILDELRFRFLDNADAMFFCMVYYKLMGLTLERDDLLKLSIKCLERTKWLYLGKEENIQRAYDQLTASTPGG